MRFRNLFFTSCASTGILIAMLGFVTLSSAFGAGSRGLYSSEASRSAAEKLRQLREGSVSGQANPSVRISEAELNAYLEDKQSNLPQGITAIHVKLQPSHPVGTAEIDFDLLKSGMKTPPNPLLALFFQGQHTLGVDGTFTSSNGEGQYHLDTVTLDGIEIPQMIVDYMIDNFLKSHYPDFPVNRAFPLGNGIDQLTIESGSVLVTGRPITASSGTQKTGKIRDAAVIPVREALNGRVRSESR